MTETETFNKIIANSKIGVKCHLRVKKRGGLVMKLEVRYFSKSGNTKKLAEVIAEEAKQQ